jgi:hypothetical protein
VSSALRGQFGLLSDDRIHEIDVVLRILCASRGALE